MTVWDWIGFFIVSPLIISTVNALMFNAILLKQRSASTVAVAGAALALLLPCVPFGVSRMMLRLGWVRQQRRADFRRRAIHQDLIHHHDEFFGADGDSAASIACTASLVMARAMAWSAWSADDDLCCPICWTDDEVAVRLVVDDDGQDMRCIVYPLLRWECPTCKTAVHNRCAVHSTIVRWKVGGADPSHHILCCMCRTNLS